MESIRYNPSPIAESPEDLRRNLDDELRRIKDWTENYRDDFIAVDNFNIVVGGTPVGTVANARTLKDNNYYQVPETASGFDIECEFSNVGSIKGFVSMIRYTGSGNHVVTLSLWDYVNTADDDFYDIPHTATRDAYRTVFIPDDTKYINSSNQSIIRLFHGTPANGTHNIFIDYIALIGTRNARY